MVVYCEKDIFLQMLHHKWNHYHFIYGYGIFIFDHNVSTVQQHFNAISVYVYVRLAFLFRNESLNSITNSDVADTDGVEVQTDT